MTVIKPCTKNFLAIVFTNPNWEFGAPAFLLKPVLKYDTEGDIHKLVDEAINACLMADDLENEDIKEAAKFNGTTLAELKRVCSERLQGKDTWSIKNVRVLFKKVQFKIIDAETGEMEEFVLESKEV